MMKVMSCKSKKKEISLNFFLMKIDVIQVNFNHFKSHDQSQ